MSGNLTEREKSRYWNRMLMLVVPLLAVLLLHTYERNEWQNDSEALVLGRMYQVQEGLPSAAGFMQRFSTEDGGVDHDLLLDGTIQLYGSEEPLDPATEVQPEYYLHQTAIQADVYAFLNKMLCFAGISAPVRLALIRGLNSFVFFVLAGVVLGWICEWMGNFAAAAVIFSVWITQGAGNLYWSYWSFLLPIVCSIQICRIQSRQDKVPLKWWLLFAAAIAVRFMCGFEFVPTIMIAFEIPALSYWVRAPKEKRRQFCMIFVKLAIIGLTMFVVCFVSWFIQTSVYYGSAALAYEDVFGVIADRTRYFGEDAVTVSQKLTKMMTIFKNYWRAIPGGIVTPLRLTQFYLAISGLYVLKKWYAHQKIEKEEIGTWAVVAISYLAPCSWFILANRHCALHYHINFILWFLPTYPLVISHMWKLASQLFLGKETAT